MLLFCASSSKINNLKGVHFKYVAVQCLLTVNTVISGIYCTLYSILYTVYSHSTVRTTGTRYSLLRNTTIFLQYCTYVCMQCTRTLPEAWAANDARRKWMYSIYRYIRTNIQTHRAMSSKAIMVGHHPSNDKPTPHRHRMRQFDQPCFEQDKHPEDKSKVSFHFFSRSKLLSSECSEIGDELSLNPVS